MANPDHSKSIKLEKFTGTYYKRWANQIRYWLTTLGLISVIDGSNPASSSGTDPNSPSSNHNQFYGPSPPSTSSTSS